MKSVTNRETPPSLPTRRSKAQIETSNKSTGRIRSKELIHSVPNHKITETQNAKTSTKAHNASSNSNVPVWQKPKTMFKYLAPPTKRFELQS